MTVTSGVTANGCGHEPIMQTRKARVTSFENLEVFRNTYRASIQIMSHVIPKLPESERYDLKQQLSRSCKAVPRLIAEGFAKRHQRNGFQKYLYDAIGECNESLVSLAHCRDLYGLLVGDENLLHSLIDLYDKSARQLYRLTDVWNSFRRDIRQPSPPAVSHDVTDNRGPTAERGDGSEPRTT